MSSFLLDNTHISSYCSWSCGRDVCLFWMSRVWSSAPWGLVVPMLGLWAQLCRTVRSLVMTSEMSLQSFFFWPVNRRDSSLNSQWLPMLLHVVACCRKADEDEDATTDAASWQSCGRCLVNGQCLSLISYESLSNEIIKSMQISRVFFIHYRWQLRQEPLLDPLVRGPHSDQEMDNLYGKAERVVSEMSRLVGR